MKGVPVPIDPLEFAIEIQFCGSDAAEAVRTVKERDLNLAKASADRAIDWLIASDLYYMPEEMETRNEAIEGLRRAIMGKEGA